jgi:hypothetical protein
MTSVTISKRRIVVEGKVSRGDQGSYRYLIQFELDQRPARVRNPGIGPGMRPDGGIVAVVNVRVIETGRIPDQGILAAIRSGPEEHFASTALPVGQKR